MKISWPSSKRCSTASAAALLFLSCTPLWAAPAPAESVLEKDIRTRQKGSAFEPLLKRWGTLYGADAVHPLVRMASNRALPDHERYIALMGAAKLGGPATAPLLEKFFKDPSWMLRSATLRAYTAFGLAGATRLKAETVLPLLKDPALVVRMEAVEAVARLRPAGAVEALLSALERRENYHAGRAQWVPQRILQALRQLKATNAASRLLPLLDHKQDPSLQEQTLATLEAITGTRRGLGLPLPERIREWKVALRR
ncbi:MAG: HEAT repeat domain-containing protein [Oligoflexia bacterium]|nr:HEAT repeat domain-containing protein [Oligoflexia bacterium]